MINKLFIEATVKALQEGQFEVVASTGQQDRVGDSINPAGWFLRNYKKNPVILWAHNNLEPPVAKALRVWVDENKLMLKGEFAPTQFAQELRALVEGGFLNAVSVGFLPLTEDEEKGDIEIEGKMYRRATSEELKDLKRGVYREEGTKFVKQELLEVSWVDVPALPTALITARRMNLDLVAKAMEEAQEQPEKDKEPEDEDKYFDVGIVGKPYPGEHSCRLEAPDKYKKFRRQNCKGKSDGKCIDFIFGVTEDSEVELQSMRYKTDVWDETDARSHCKESKGKFEPAAEESMETKEGRVISEKNRRIIQNTISALGEATNVLQDLLKISESPKDIVPSKDADKGRILGKPVKSDISQKKIQLLRIANKALDELLREAKLE